MVKAAQRNLVQSLALTYPGTFITSSCFLGEHFSLFDLLESNVWGRGGVILFVHRDDQ